MALPFVPKLECPTCGLQFHELTVGARRWGLEGYEDVLSCTKCQAPYYVNLKVMIHKRTFPHLYEPSELRD